MGLFVALFLAIIGIFLIRTGPAAFIFWANAISWLILIVTDTTPGFSIRSIAGFTIVVTPIIILWVLAYAAVKGTLQNLLE